MTYNGPYQRLAPRVNVLSGYWGNEPFSRKRSAPVTSGVTIQSGQVISLVSGQWVLGAATGLEPYIAFHDSSDTDVVSSGLLLGLSCAGQFDIETAWFDNTKTYTDSSPLVAATGGSSTALAAPLTGALGAVTLGSSTAQDIIGFAVNGGRQATGSSTNGAAWGNTVSAHPPVGYTAAYVPGVNSEAAVAYVLAFRTLWRPAEASFS
jgi:hypothetical protein